MIPMTASERLQNARASIFAGHYPEALTDLIWFHENALAEEPSLCGVRLSFALGAWVDLGEKYPPALTALERVRDKKASALVLGKLDASAFNDIAAINEHLNVTSSTYCLYLELAKAQPELASACAGYALPSIVDAKDFPLAVQLSPDAETSIREWSNTLNYRIRMIKHGSYSRAPMRWTYVCNHVEEIQRLLNIKVGIGDHGEAARLKALAIALIESPSLRREVQAGFVKRPKPPVPRR